jgi:hypothetical protein
LLWLQGRWSKPDPCISIAEGLASARNIHSSVVFSFFSPIRKELPTVFPKRPTTACASADRSDRIPGQKQATNEVVAVTGYAVPMQDLSSFEARLDSFANLLQNPPADPTPAFADDHHNYHQPSLSYPEAAKSCR